MALPLFPLPNVVLLPGQVLPLYVFEPRYRELLARVRETGEPFGVARLKPDEPGGVPFASRVARVGTLAHLREVVNHEDGTASILVVGGERFEVLGFDCSRSYLSAQVRLSPLPVGNAEVVDALARRVLDGVSRVNHTEAGRVREHAPSDPLYIATYGSILLPLLGEQREAVLRAPSLEARLNLLAAWVPGIVLN